MQFAKVFDIDGTQVLCVLQPRDEDGLPEMRMVTYVGDTCVVFGNRLVPPGIALDDPQAVLTRTREIFDGFGREEAEQAYRAAQKMIAEAAERARLQTLPTSDASAGDDADFADPDFKVPLVSRVLH